MDREITPDVVRGMLDSIAKARGVRLLLAVESGSRAWGFPSIDSDYDVRFIYAHPAEWYLSLVEKRDVIEAPSDDGLLDVGGWDIRKALRLLMKGNAALFEWLQSPTVYASDAEFHAQLLGLAPDYYSLKAGVHHYLGLVRGVLGDIEKETTLKVKRLLYGVRAALSARWIIANGALPPMEYGHLSSLLDLNSPFRVRVSSLIAEKAERNESFSVDGADDFQHYLAETITLAERAFDSLANPSGRVERLEELFRTVLRGSGSGS